MSVVTDIIRRVLDIERRVNRLEIGNEARAVLKNNITYYVRTDGNDSNDGLSDTPTGAFLTIQRAVNQAMRVDANNKTITIKVADGTYTGNVLVTGRPVGIHYITIEGNNTAPGNVIVNGRIRAEMGAILNVIGMRVNPASGVNALQAIYFAYLSAQNVEVQGAGGAAQIYALLGSQIALSGTLNRILAGSTYCFGAERNSYIGIAGTWTIGANLTYANAFATSIAVSTLYNLSASFVLGGFTVTGKRYDVILNAVINSQGAGVNWLPGTVAGTTSSGGQYV